MERCGAGVARREEGSHIRAHQTVSGITTRVGSSPVEIGRRTLVRRVMLDACRGLTGDTEPECRTDTCGAAMAPIVYAFTRTPRSRSAPPFAIHQGVERRTWARDGPER